MDPEVTVVIATRDRPALVAGAIDSALAQTVAAVEVLVVDDGSVEPVRPHLDEPRLRLLRLDPPRGVCAARNLGLARARGRWITFLDDDDRLLPDMLERSLQAARASTLPPPVAAISVIEDVDEAGRPLGSVLRPASLARSAPGSPGGAPGAPASHATLLAPTEVMLAIGGWDEALRAWEHTDLFLRLQAACSVQAVERVTYRRRVHRSARLSENLPARVASMRRTLAKHEAAFARHARRRATYLGAIGIAWLRMGRWGPAVAATTASLRVDPARPRGVAQWLASLAGPRVWALLDPRRRGGRRS
ncbi:MAG TPA: glycosyltransferase [Actinomycetes bacterium]|nr:glycosyltransferase [Actinomycetes bacterium]